MTDLLVKLFVLSTLRTNERAAFPREFGKVVPRARFVLFGRRAVFIFVK